MSLFILDKCFFQSENCECSHLKSLCQAGHKIVLTDTLVFEVADKKVSSPLTWECFRKKLLQIKDSLVIWKHTSLLMRDEISPKTPIKTPEEPQEFHRRWIYGLEEYWVDNPPKQEDVDECKHQREKDTFNELRNVFSVFKELWSGIDWSQPREKLLPRIKEDLDPLTKYWTKLQYGNPQKSDLYIPCAENGLTNEWFLFRHSRCLFAVIFLYLLKHGKLPELELTEKILQRYVNTSHDLDYLLLLHYADGILTQESKKNDMGIMHEILFGETKPMIALEECEQYCQKNVDELKDNF